MLARAIGLKQKKVARAPWRPEPVRAGGPFRRATGAQRAALRLGGRPECRGTSPQDRPSLGVDTNVFYTPTTGSPTLWQAEGLASRCVRPLDPKANSRLRLDGGADYLYYARTDALRRWNGHSSALLELHGVKTDLVI